MLIGGYVFDRVAQEGTELITEYVRTILEANKKGHEFAIVAGGGKLARDYIG
ncbi:MAG: UMP kinase, partial [Thermoproteota archaeon]